MIQATILSKIQQIYSIISAPTAATINSIQVGSGASGGTATITAVDTSKSFVIFNGTTGYTATGTVTPVPPPFSGANSATSATNILGGGAILTNSTTVTLIGNAGVTVHFTVVEFN